MAKINCTPSGRNQLTVVVPPPSPLPSLIRTRSGSNLSAIITTPERSSRRFSTSERHINYDHRSKSTSKVRAHNKQGINTNPTLLVSNKFQKKKKSIDGFDKFLQNGVSPDNNGASRRATLPSAWALSPGRGSLSSPFGSESSARVKESGGGGGGGVGSGVAKVLKYFKQKKVSSLQEEMYHRFRILHNRHLQWRFVNARAEVAMTNVKNVAEIHLFSVWLEIHMLRKIIIQKRMELQKVKYIIKLYHILKGQLSLLTEWEKLKKVNQESIYRITRKLSAMSTTLPLTHGLKADTKTTFEALNMAIEVIENIKPLITKFQTQVTELTTTSKEEEVCLQELLEIVPIIATLMENEKSIQVRLIQTTMESNHNNYPCLIAQS